MKKVKKIIFIISIVMLMVFLSNICYGFSVTELQGSTVDNPEVTNIGNKIITVLSTIGAIISVVVLVVLGIKYMLGSTEEKAQYKKSLMPYTIGAAITFSASILAGYIYSMIISWGN